MQDCADEAAREKGSMVKGGIFRKKPVFLLVDFHYGVAQANRAMLRQLGCKTHMICGSGHYLQLEWRAHRRRRHVVRWHHILKARVSAHAAHWVDRLFLLFYPPFADYLAGAFLQASYKIEGVNPQIAWHDEYMRQHFLRHPLIRKWVAASDYVLCTFPPKIAHIAVWLAQHEGKRVFFLGGHRFNIHLRSQEDNAEWKAALRRLASDAAHIVAVYGAYEERYTQYFLPDISVQRFPLAMSHIPLIPLKKRAAWRPLRRRPSVPSARPPAERAVWLYDNYAYGGHHPLFEPLKEAAHNAADLRAANIRFYARAELLAHKTLHGDTDKFLAMLAQCHAIVVFPYSAYSILFCELYEMNIPMFIPSDAFLLRLSEAGRQVVPDRTLFPMYCTKEIYREMEPQDNPQTSPNSYELSALRQWLPLMEHFQRGNMQRFESVEDLFRQLVSLDRAAVADAMRKENLQRRHEARQIWRQAIARSWQHPAPPRARPSQELSP